MLYERDREEVWHLLHLEVALFADFASRMLGAPVELSGKINNAIPI